MTTHALINRVVRPLLPRRARPRRVLRGPLRGCQIVVSWHDYPAGLLGYTEGALLRWLSTAVRSGETWLDVGAHYGYTAVALARLVGPSGRVFAFEPVLATARCLSETLRLNHLDQVEVVSLGLSDFTEVGPMEVALTRGMAQPDLGAGGVPETISVVSLDQIWGRLAKGDELVHGVKLDVQGMELRALAGMRAILTTHRPVIAIEFHADVDRRGVLQLLGACGYHQAGTPVDRLPGEDMPYYADNRTYVFYSKGSTGPC